MYNYCTNFAKTGNPNGFSADGSTMPEWTPYTTESRYIMLFGDKAGMDESNRSELAKLVLESGDDIIETLRFKR
jgi:carboxylesterase type B